MANPQINSAVQNITYISAGSPSGASDNTNIAVIQRRDVPIGVSFYKMKASGTTDSVGLTPPEIQKFGFPQGDAKPQGPNANYFTTQRTVSPLSGMKSNFAPSTGDGLSSVVTTPATDVNSLNLTVQEFAVGGKPASSTKNLATGSGLYNLPSVRNTATPPQDNA